MLDKARHKWWSDRRWGVKSLVALGRKSDAIRYAENSKGLNEPLADIARTCEEILITSGMVDEAYKRYALLANQNTTNLATFRAIAKKYPHKTANDILTDLVASQSGSEGKWFAAAKDAGLFDLAIELVNRSPTDPRTLIRAAKDFAITQPEFALASGMAGLRYLVKGYGYDITGLDVLDAYSAVMDAAHASGIEEHQMKTNIRALISDNQPTSEFARKILAHRLAE